MTLSVLADKTAPGLSDVFEKSSQSKDSVTMGALTRRLTWLGLFRVPIDSKSFKKESRHKTARSCLRGKRK